MKKLLALSMLVLGIMLSGCLNKEEPPTPPLAGEEPETPPPPPAGSLGLKVELAPDEMKTPETKQQVITFDSGNLYFRPNAHTVKVNTPVTVNYTNKGTHSFSVDGLGINVALTAASGSFNFTPKKTGTFEIYCNVVGHKQAGMTGTLTVTE